MVVGLPPLLAFQAVTGVTLYVDNGLHAMGMAVDSNGGRPTARACRCPAAWPFSGV